MIQLQTLLDRSTSSETLALTAIIDTALCVGAGGSSGSLADKPIIRTADGRLLIPASQLKGRLRHECEKLARGLGWAVCESPKAQTMCPQRAGFSASEQAKYHRENYRVDGYEGHHCLICQLFGNPSLPSRLVFDDLICTEPAENLAPEILRPSVTINRRRRIAEDKKLYFLETSPPNSKLRFTGNIYLQSQTPAWGKALIQAAIMHVKALGGSKSAGLGWLHWKFEPLAIEETIWQNLIPESLI